MPSHSFLLKFIVFFLTTIASIAISLEVKDKVDWQNFTSLMERQKGNLNQQNKVITSKIADSNSSNKTTGKVELSSKLKAEETSAELATYQTTLAFEQYEPRHTIATIHPSNYGDRYSTDLDDNLLNNAPIAVLHETTNSVKSAINTFRTPHHNDSNQVSYHALITLDGTIIYLVPSDKRAFGAGNSVFVSSSDIETVKTNPDLPSSVNNFAYHISLETPLDGRKSNQTHHSGYTNNQYKSLAWLLASSDIPDNRITTHQNVDRSGQKIDPRSFNFDKFFKLLHTYRQPTEVDLSKAE